MSTVHVDAMGLTAPGMAGWSEGREVLTGRSAYLAEEVPPSKPEMLPANERRRISPTIRLALKVAEEAVSGSSLDMHCMSSVFATCDGDTEIIDRICMALTLPERPVSPTQFHNSVHNAPAGYWAIAAHSPMPSTTVSAYRASFAAGLMEAASQLQVDGRPVLLVGYDHTAPDPLKPCVGSFPPFAVAMAMSPLATPGSRRLGLEIVHDQHESRVELDDLETLRNSNPTAVALPLLQALARDGAERIVLPHVNGLQLAVDVDAR